MKEYVHWELGTLLPCCAGSLFDAGVGGEPYRAGPCRAGGGLPCPCPTQAIPPSLGGGGGGEGPAHGGFRVRQLKNIGTVSLHKIIKL